MAKITPSFGPISGKLGGVVFSHNRYGAYVRAKVIPVNPRSVPQVLERAHTADAAAEYSQLSGLSKDGWETYAKGTPIQGRDGAPITLSGQAMYVRLNRYRDSTGMVTHISAPPMLGAIAPQISDVIYGWGAGPPKTLDLTCTSDQYPMAVAIYANAARTGVSGFSPAPTWIMGSGELLIPGPISGVYAAYLAVFGTPVAGSAIRFHVVGQRTTTAGYEGAVGVRFGSFTYTI